MNVDVNNFYEVYDFIVQSKLVERVRVWALRVPPSASTWSSRD